MKNISSLHYITQDIENKSHAQLTTEACDSGINWVQLRLKNQPYEKWLVEAKAIREICSNHQATFIINDNVALAKEVNADGVHLGKDDMAPQDARVILGADKIIGGTANTFEDIERLVAAGVDYIGLGPFRFTVTKENLSPVLGLEGYSAILEKCRKAGISTPVIAIGGIVPEDVEAIAETGVHGIAVSSGINKAKNKPAAVTLFQEMLDGKTVS